MATTVRSAQSTTREVREPTGAALALAPLVGRFDARAPGGRRFGLRFWDGSELAPSASARDDAPWLVVRHPTRCAASSPRPASSA